MLTCLQIGFVAHSSEKGFVALAQVERLSDELVRVERLFDEVVLVESSSVQYRSLEQTHQLALIDSMRLGSTLPVRQSLVAWLHCRLGEEAAHMHRDWSFVVEVDVAVG